ncbi:MAG: molybdopterin-dependent oxidoreductase [Candidatus Bathyarchaeia archaeon]
MKTRKLQLTGKPIMGNKEKASRGEYSSSDGKSCVKNLSLGGFSGGGDLCRVDFNKNKIVRIRPLRFDWNYRPEELPSWSWKAHGKVFKPLMKELIPPLRLVYRNSVYSPNRVMYPLKRVDWNPEGNRNPQNRGLSRFVRISWDEAIKLIVGEIKRILENYGPYAICAHSEGHGQTKSVHGAHGVICHLLKHLGGFTYVTRNPDSWEGWWWGAKHVWGNEPYGLQPTLNVIHDVAENCEVLLCWGCDYETNHWGFADQGWSRLGFWFSELGIKQIFICPDLNYAAAIHADKWIPIRPNTDAALQLAIAYIWIKEELYDKEYVATHTVGFEEFKNYVLGHEDNIPKTPKWAEEITGIPSRTIKALATLWASKRTSIAHMMGGPYIRGPYATEPARLEILLLAMQGIGKPGIQQLNIWAARWLHLPVLMPFTRKTLREWSAYALSMTEKELDETLKQVIIKTKLPDAILKPPANWCTHGMFSCSTECQLRKFTYPASRFPEIRMIWKTTNCTLTCWNGGFMFAEAYRSPKIEFILAQSPWLENDCTFADIILPATTPIEEEDISIGPQQANTQFNFIAICKKCIEPIGESKSDYEICCMIAEKLGPAIGKPDLLEKFTEGKSIEEWKKAMLEESGASTLISLEELEEKSYYLVPLHPQWKDLRVFPPGMRPFYEDPECNPLDTPSGKIEFYSERLARYFPGDLERPPVPHYIPYGESWQESLQHPRAKKYPFLLVSNHPRWRMHAQLDYAVWLREIPTCKVKGPDGYLYEPVWINPLDAEKLGVKTGDIAKVFNERGTVLCGVRVTERIMPGVVSVDHGARADIISLEDKIDRGGAINLIAPHEGGKNTALMVVSGYLVAVQKANLEELKDKYPEAFQRKIHPLIGPYYTTYVLSNTIYSTN